MALSLGSVDRRNPVNWRHPLNAGRKPWLLSLPGWMGGGKWPDLCRSYDATLAGFSGSNAASAGWRPATRAGGIGSVLFDGSAAYAATAASVAAPASVACFAMAAWVRPAGTSGFNCILRIDGGGASGPYIYQNGSGFYCSTGTGSISGGSLSAGSWFRAMLAWASSGAATLYVNGVQAGSATGTTLGTPQRLAIASVSPSSASSPFPGAIDDVAVWFNSPLLATNPAAFARLDYDESRLGYPRALVRPRRRFGVAASLPYCVGDDCSYQGFFEA